MFKTSFVFLNVITMIILDSVLNSHAPNYFDSDFWTWFICILFNLVCVRVATYRSQVTNFSAVCTCCSLEFAICFLVSFFSTT